MLRILLMAMVCLGITVNISAQREVPYVTPIRWSYDGSQIAIVVNNTVELRSAANGELLHVLSGHRDGILSTDWSPNSLQIVTASSDQTVKVWDSDSGELIANLTGNNDIVYVLAWSHNGNQIVGFASGIDSSSELSVWNARTYSLSGTYYGGGVINAVYDQTDQYLAVTTGLSLNIIETNQFSVIVGSPRVLCCANLFSILEWSTDENQIATGSISGLVTIWNAKTLTQVNQFVANSFMERDSRDVPDLSLSWVRDVFWNSDNTLQAVSGDGTIRVWDMASSTVLQERNIGHLDTATWSPFGGRLAVVGSDETLSIILPFISFERLQSIADLCDAPLTIPMQADQLSEFITQIEALPADSIPPACAADLIAVAEAIRAGE